MFYLIFLFTVLPVTELMLLFRASDVIGGLNTVAIVVLTGVVGASLARSQGMSLLAKIQQQMQRGEVPTDNLLQGFLVFGGGLLLMTPGFVTDVMGLAMVLPGSRWFFAQLVKKYFLHKIKTGQMHVMRTTIVRDPFRENAFYRDDRTIKEAKVIEVKDVTEEKES